MARQARFVAAGQPHLVAQPALMGTPLFPESSDCLHFLSLLREASRQYSLAIHAYALLPHRFLLLATPAELESLPRAMQQVGRRYVPFYNQKYGRSGTLWQGRFRASVVESSQFFTPACRWVEEAPVREGLAAQVADWPWSSYRAHAGLAPAEFLAGHRTFWELGNTPFEREAAYARQFDRQLDKEMELRISNSLSSGWVIGSKNFIDLLEQDSQRRLQPGKRGRPPASRSIASE